jgi:hypothetical protein
MKEMDTSVILFNSVLTQIIALSTEKATKLHSLQWGLSHHATNLSSQKLLVEDEEEGERQLNYNSSYMSQKSRYVLLPVTLTFSQLASSSVVDPTTRHEN